MLCAFRRSKKLVREEVAPAGGGDSNPSSVVDKKRSPRQAENFIAEKQVESELKERDNSVKEPNTKLPPDGEDTK